MDSLDALNENAISAAIQTGYLLAQAKQTPRKTDVLDALPYVVLRDAAGNENVVYLEGRSSEPPRKTGRIKLSDAKSFIAYYKAHALTDSQWCFIYAQMQPAQFLAVLNDHSAAKAGFRDYRVEFPVAHSKEWNTWANHSSTPFSGNEAFAYFIEENSPDIIKPAGNEMLSIALNFKIGESVAFSNAARLSDGHTELTYNNIVSASSVSEKGGKIKIPEQFRLRLPVFAGIDAKQYEVDARLRYRLRDGKLTIWYELIRPFKALETAFKDLWLQIEKETKATILAGTPE